MLKANKRKYLKFRFFLKIMADSKSNEQDIELKDFSAAIEPREDKEQTNEDIEEITAETPFITDSNETTAADVTQVANQQSDLAATQQEAETESLLVRQNINLDEIQTEPVEPTQTALGQFQSKLTQMTIQQRLTCVATGFLNFLTKIVSCEKSPSLQVS